jgi:hypothetical protein
MATEGRRWSLLEELSLRRDDDLGLRAAPERPVCASLSTPQLVDPGHQAPRLLEAVPAALRGLSMQDPANGLPRIRLLRLYEKSSNTGEPPRHEANHGSVYQRFAARTLPLVVFAHPPVLVDSGQRPFHHPPPRQHHKALGGNSFCQSRATPSLAHSLAHITNTSSGESFHGRSTSSALQPRVFSTQSAPLSSPL